MIKSPFRRGDTNNMIAHRDNRIGTRKIIMILGIAALFLSLILSPYGVRRAKAWEKDVHFYLIYYLTIATCFEPSETYLIALGDWSVDTFHGTSPLPTLSDIKNKDWSRFINSGRDYHALGEVEEVMKRYNYLRTAALDDLKNPLRPKHCFSKIRSIPPLQTRHGITLRV